MMFKMIVFNPLDDAVKLKSKMSSCCHLGIQPSGNPSPQKFLWRSGFDPQDPQNIHVCKCRLEFLSYIKNKIK